MPYATLEEMAAGLEEMRGYDPAYFEKMMHKLPHAPSVQREAWLVERVRGATVLHLGCNGHLHPLLQQSAAMVYGIDREQKPDKGYWAIDLDEELDLLPRLTDVTLILAAEVLEHLVSPGWLLKVCRSLYPEVPLIVTAPNAFAGQPKLRQGYVCVNRDHNAWYCMRTLHVLLEKCGYRVTERLYYHGKPPTSEGLIVVAAPVLP